MSDTLQQALVSQGMPAELSREVEHPCEGARFHSPRPIGTQLYVWGRNKYWLCGTCRENLQVLLHLADDNPDLDWKLLREFGNQLRSIGLQILGRSETA